MRRGEGRGWGGGVDDTADTGTATKKQRKITKQNITKKASSEKWSPATRLPDPDPEPSVSPTVHQPHTLFDRGQCGF